MKYKPINVLSGTINNVSFHGHVFTCHAEKQERSILMNHTIAELYKFNVLLKEQEDNVGYYSLNVFFLGDHDFYNRLISVAKKDSVLLTCRAMPFFMKLLHQEKYLFYFEQASKKKTKHVQWSIERILRNEEDHVQLENSEDAQEIQKAILFHLNLFAREEAKKISKQTNK